MSELVIGVSLIAVTAFLGWGSWITKASIQAKIDNAKLKQELCDHLK